MLNREEPSALAVAVGKSKVGPTPQISPLALAGEKKKLWLISPRPKWEVLNSPNRPISRLSDGRAWLIDQRGNGAADDVPIAKRNGNYRLDVEHVSSGVMVGTDLTIDVVLKRQADHRSDRVLRGLGKVLRRLLGKGRRY